MKILFIRFISFVIAIGLLLSLGTVLKNKHFISIEKFEEKTSEFDFIPKQNDLGTDCKCKGRIIKKGIVFQRTFYELFVEFDSEETFLEHQKKVDETYTYQDINIQGVFGGLNDHIVCEKDGFQFRIADIETLGGYAKEYLLIGQSQEKKEFIFVFINDEDIERVDNWNKYLRSELYI